MDRGTWLTTVHVVSESDTTEPLTLSLSIIKKKLTSQGNSQEGETIRNNSVKFLAQVIKKKKKNSMIHYVYNLFFYLFWKEFVCH